MANPPYSALVLVIRENQDGGNAMAFVFNEIPEGQPMPRGLPGFFHNLQATLDLTKVPQDRFIDRNFTTRTTLKNAFATLVDQTFPDTAP